MIHKLTEYLMRKLPNSFKGWTQEALEDYVMWQIERNQLVAVVDDQEEIRSMVIGWPTEEMQVELFRWQEPTKHGRYWFWDQIAADTPEAFMVCISQFFLRRPESSELPSFGVRHGKIREFRPAMLIYKKGNEIYGN